VTAHSQIARCKSSGKSPVLAFVEAPVDSLLDETEKLAGRVLEM
jgi:hypothetical protein